MKELEIWYPEWWNFPEPHKRKQIINRRGKTILSRRKETYLLGFDSWDSPGNALIITRLQAERINIKSLLI